MVVYNRLTVFNNFSAVSLDNRQGYNNLPLAS